MQCNISKQVDKECCVFNLSVIKDRRFNLAVGADRFVVILHRVKRLVCSLEYDSDVSINQVYPCVHYTSASIS